MPGKPTLDEIFGGGKSRPSLDQFFGAGGPTDTVRPSIVEEMHPDVSALDRLVVKNFGNSPESELAYFKKKLPKHDVTLQDNRVLIRRPGEKEYKVVDPDTGFFSKDILHDVGDIAYDVAGGPVQAAAVTAGGLAGNLPGAAAAGAGSSAALEAARQQIGKILGIPQNVSGTDVAIQGAVGGALPLVGAGLKGLYQGVTRKVLPMVGESASGVRRDLISGLKSELPNLSKIEDEGVMATVVDPVQASLEKGFGETRRILGGKVGEAIASAPGKVNLTGVMEPLEKLLAEAEASALKNPEALDEVQAIKYMMGRVFEEAPDTTAKASPLLDQFGKLIESGPKEAVKLGELNPKDAFRLQSQLKHHAKLQNIQSGLQTRFGKADTAMSKRIQEAMRAGYNELNNQFDTVTEGVSTQAKADFRKLMQIEDLFDRHFSDSNKTFSTLSNLGNKAKLPLREKLHLLEEASGVDLKKAAKTIQTNKAFGVPSLDSQSGEGSTSTTRTIPLAALGGTLGALAGYKSGGGYTGAALGGMLGMKAGTLGGSPASIKKMIELGIKAEQAAGRIPKGAVPALTKSAWDLYRRNNQ